MNIVHQPRTLECKGGGGGGMVGSLYSECSVVGWQRYLEQTLCFYVASLLYASSIMGNGVTSTMRRAAHPSGCARCGAGAGCSAIKYQSLFIGLAFEAHILLYHSA